MKIKAKRPHDSLDNKEERFQFMCETCWQSVEQPCIKGIFYHDDDWQQKSYQCKNLVPVKRRAFNLTVHGSKCLHEFRFHPDLGGAVKCVKCGQPQRIDLYELTNERRNYFCIQCNKKFKILSEHYVKVHKKKGFEFNRLEMPR